MEIALIADDTRKELLAQFCIAYRGILSKHSLCATSATGQYVQEASGLHIEQMLPGSHGGEQQIISRIAYNEIDAVIYFRSQNTNQLYPENELELIQTCDNFNIPVATNLASAEIIICALERGDLDWREIVNPISDYNRRRGASNKI